MTRPRAVLAAILALLGAFCLLARRSELVRSVELKTYDWRFRRFSDPREAGKDIVLLLLDQQSLDQFEKDDVYWPWPRSMYNAVLEFCKAGGARAVVFDALFTSRSPYGASEDPAFAAGLKAAGTVVMAMEMGAPQPRRGTPPPARFALEAAGSLSGAAVLRRSVRLPMPVILGAVPMLADTAAAPDPDGVFRRVSLVSEMGGRYYPTLAAAAVLAAGNAKTASLEGGVLNLGGRRVPLTDGAMLIRFHGPQPFLSYPLGRVIQAWQNIMEGQPAGLAPAAVKGKIVMIGYSAPGLMDARPSPFSSLTPGTAIVAAAADNILNGDFIRPASGAAAALLILVALLGAAAISRLLEDIRLSLLGVALLSAGLALSAILAFTRGVWLDMAAPQLSLWLGFAAAAAFGYATEGRQKRQIHRAFSHYLAPEVVDEIAADPEKLALGGERRELTCYFSDLENFTTISEGLTPERLASLMNRSLGVMTETILESKGTLDKYIGDAIMAFWGAPMPRPDHALTACRVALENQARLAVLRRQLEAEGYPPVRTRIGLNSGPASVGNMGTARRFSYTALGDNVNLASRLEGANKAYGTYILISESTRQQAGDGIETRELDLIKVKGKTRPVRVFELLGLKGGAAPRVLEEARRFEAALALLRARRWAEAAEAFEALRRERPDDHAAELYILRLKAFKDAPPPADWDGSFALTEK